MTEESDVEKVKVKSRTTIIIVSILAGLLGVLLMAALFTGTVGAIDESVLKSLSGIAKVLGLVFSAKEAVSGE